MVFAKADVVQDKRQEGTSAKRCHAPVPEGDISRLLSLPLITVEEAASILRISTSLAYDGIANGDIPSIRIKRSLRVPTAALKRKLMLED